WEGRLLVSELLGRVVDRRRCGLLDHGLPLQVHEGEPIAEAEVTTKLPAELLVEHDRQVTAGRLAILVDDPDGTEGAALSRAGDDDLAAHVPDGVRHDEPPLSVGLRVREWESTWRVTSSYTGLPCCTLSFGLGHLPLA